MAKTLVMTFLNEGGKKTSLRVDNIKDSIKKEEISSVMNTIIQKNIFMTANGSLKSREAAQIEEKNVSKIEVK